MTTGLYEKKFYFTCPHCEYKDPIVEKDENGKILWELVYDEFGQSRYEYPSYCGNCTYFYEEYGYTTGDLNNIYRCKKIPCRGKNFLKTLDN